jgi:hypothetical protein
MAAKSGTPQMENYHPTVPLDIPATAAGALTTQEVGISVVGSSDVIDKSPDARQNGAAPATATPSSAAPGAQDQPAAAPSTTAGKKGASAPKKLKQVAAKPPKVPKVPRPAASKKGTAAQKGTADSLPTPDKKQ